jgi:hypothetical protein
MSVQDSLEVDLDSAASVTGFLYNYLFIFNIFR